MKRIVLVGILWLGACKTAAPADVRSHPEAAAITMDAFATADRWIETGERSAALVEATAKWNSPRVERMHRTSTGYLALVTSDGAANAVLLTLRVSGGVWSVTEARPERADYLWPTQ